MGERQDIPLPTGSFSVAVVLVGVTHPGNLGAICRTMLNYGFDDLRLINPKCSPGDGETRARAKHAVRLLDELSIYNDISSAAHDCSTIIGTSGKRETGDKTLFRHYLYPWDMVERLNHTGGKVALVFGEEGKGLSTEALGACDYFVTLPTWEGYPILNLSHAVTVLCFSWFTGVSDNPVPGTEGRILDPQLRRILREEVTRLVQLIPTKDHKRQGMDETLVRVIMRGLPKDDEIHRILGILSAAADSFENDES